MRPFTNPVQLPRHLVAFATVALLLVGTGCEYQREPARRYDDGDNGPPPVRVVTNYAPNGPAKPLPPQDDTAGGLPPAYADPAIVRQQAPEEPRYLQAYNNIGKPKLVVFVNRTVTGELVPVTPAVTVRTGVGPYDDRGTTYLRAGQYDEAQAKSIDYQLVENLLTEDLSADGKVAVIAPISARQRLGDDEVREIQAGRPQMLGELAVKLNADVLVQVTAHPSQETEDGLGIRLVAEAVNTHGGQAIAFAAVDVPPPLTKPRLNEFVRFVARKLMDGMSTSWEDMAVPNAAPVSVQPRGLNPMTDGPITGQTTAPTPSEQVTRNPITAQPLPPSPPPTAAPATQPVVPPLLAPATPMSAAGSANARPGDLPPPP